VSQSALDGEIDPPEVDSAFDGVLPILWLHVPKTGTSFLQTLASTPGACPNFIPDLRREYSILYDGKCNNSVFDTEYFARSVHPGIEDLPGGFEAGRGRFMTFMRQPEQRFLSMVHYTEHGRNADRVLKPGATLDGKKQLFAGWATKMLVRGGATLVDRSDHDAGVIRELINFTTPAWEMNGLTAWDKFTQDYGGWMFPLSVSRAESEEAKARLQTGFSFIGITDQWDLSICLFNTMFNQTCRASQFLNNRPTNGKSQSSYDTGTLNGWRDPYDTELFDVATELFSMNLRKYNVSELSCRLCRREAGLQ